MPIFLWSTVVNQLKAPVDSRGRRSSRGTGFGATAASASSTVVMRGLPGDGRRYATSTSLQLQQELGDLLRFGLGHTHRFLERRHAHPARIGLRQLRTRVGLAAGCLPDPSPQIVVRELVLATGE